MLSPGHTHQSCSMEKMVFMLVEGNVCLIMVVNKSTEFTDTLGIRSLGMGIRD